MYEVVLFATLAVIVCVVLFSVLGRQIGRGPDEENRPEDIFGTTRDMDTSNPSGGLKGADGVAAVATNAAVLAAAMDPRDLTPVERLVAKDPEFSPRLFLDQATTAYSMVLEGFASGDRDTLAMLLTPRMQGLYGEAIDDRERQELTQVTDILRIAETRISDTRVEGKTAEVDVRFRSELSSALVDAVGQPVMGDPDLIANIEEVWTFTRQIGSSDPAWYLSDVAPEEGDDLAADPAPDTTE